MRFLSLKSGFQNLIRISTSAFIAQCRLGKPHTYDIVEGPMANDTIFNYVQSFVDGKISRRAFWELAKFKKPTHQISFHTIAALQTIKYIGKERVYGKE